MRRSIVIFLTLFLAATAIAQAPSFRFVVYGDSRNGHATHTKLVQLIRAQQPQLVLHTGDIVGRGTDTPQWRRFDQITAALRKETEFFAARGNHDVGGPGFINRFNAEVTRGNRLFFVLDRGPVRFLVIDTEQAMGSGSAQLQFIERELQTAKREAKPVMVVMHRTMFTIGGYTWDTRFQRRLHPLFKRYGVRAVFQGHDHNYYRTTRDGILYVVTGGGGAPLYDQKSRLAKPGDRFEKTYHYVLVEVSGDRATLTAIRSNGTQIDRHEFRLR